MINKIPPFMGNKYLKKYEQKPNFVVRGYFEKYITSPSGNTASPDTHTFRVNRLV